MSGESTEKFSMLSRLRTSLGSRVKNVLLNSDLGSLSFELPYPLLMSMMCLVDSG